MKRPSFRVKPKKCKLELQSYKMNQSNVPIEHVQHQPIIDDEDSLLVKARERWAEMSGVQSQSTKSPQKVKKAEKTEVVHKQHSKVTFIDVEEKQTFKPISSTPVTG